MPEPTTPESVAIVSTDPDQLEHLTRLSTEAIDELPIGAIELDAEGTVLKFNQREARLTGRDPGRVVGKNFFTEVAPCTDVQEFAGAFRQGMRERSLHKTFPYRFDYEMDPRNVWVTLFYSDTSGTGWVFVREQGATREASTPNAAV